MLKQKYETFKQHRDSARKAFEAEFKSFLRRQWDAEKDTMMKLIDEQVSNIEQSTNTIFVSIDKITVRASTLKDHTVEFYVEMKFLSLAGICIKTWSQLLVALREDYESKYLQIANISRRNEPKDIEEMEFLWSVFYDIYSYADFVIVYPEMDSKHV
jgi:aryl carrier-like protein